MNGGEFRFELPERWPGLPVGFRLLKDLNGDGRVDAYLSSSHIMQNHVVFRFAIAQMDGTFNQTHEVAFSGASSGWIEYVGDVNGDGHADLIIDTGIPRYLLLGHGDGVFDAPLPINMPTGTYGDMNGDQRDDIIEFDTFDNEVRVHLAQTDGSFVLHSKQVRDLDMALLADIDGDGDRDVVGADWTGGIYVFQNDGTGQIAAPVTIDDGSQWDSVKTMAIADLNADGRDDVVLGVGKFLGDLVVVMLGEASGQLVLGSQYDTRLPQNIDVADMDGDGYDDVVLVSQPIGVTSNDLVEIFYGDGLGGLGDRRGFWNTQGSTVSHLRDVDGDGLTDVVLAETHVALNKGNRELKAPPLSVIKDGDDAGDTINWVDFDGDAKPEFVVAQNNGPLEKYVFDAGLRLGAPELCTGAGTAADRVVRDVTGDGHPDAYVVASGTLRLWLGAGGCTFGSELLPLQNAWNMQWVDLDGDALLDAVYAPNKQIEVALATAPGSFGPPVNTANTTRCYVAPAADFNGDATVDLACVDNLTQSLTFWMADAGHHYSQGQQFTWSVNEELRNPKALDVDGDGDQDVLGAVVTNSVRLEVFLNDGTGNFTRSTLLDKIDAVGHYSVGDFDADGAIELVVPNNQKTTGVHRFTSAGTIAHLFDYEAPRGMHPYDVDHDGDLDLTYTYAYDNRMVVAVVRNLRF